MASGKALVNWRKGVVLGAATWLLVGLVAQAIGISGPLVSVLVIGAGIAAFVVVSRPSPPLVVMAAGPGDEMFDLERKNDPEGKAARLLPMIEWQEEMRLGGRFVAAMATGKARRRCRIILSAGSEPVFTWESTEDQSRFRSLTGISLRVNAKQRSGGAYWTELQGFRLTTDADHYGLMRNNGQPLGLDQINRVIVAEFTGEMGGLVIAESNTSAEQMADLHRRLLWEFVEKRPEYLRRLQAGTVDSAAAAGPSAGRRPQEL